MIVHVSETCTKTDKPWESHEEQDFFTYRGKDYFKNLKELAIEVKEYKTNSWIKKIPANHKCDIFRWNCLSRISGLYSDMDVLFIKPIDEFYEKIKNYDSIICHNGEYFSLGLMGSSGENQFFEDLYIQALSSFNIKEYQCVGPDVICAFMRVLGTAPNAKNCWKTVCEKYTPSTFYNCEMELIYPWTFTKMKEVFEQIHEELPKNCIGIHWYAGDPISQKYNNLLTETDYKKYKNTFTYYMKELLDGKR